MFFYKLDGTLNQINTLLSEIFVHKDTIINYELNSKDQTSKEKRALMHSTSLADVNNKGCGSNLPKG